MAAHSSLTISQARQIALHTSLLDGNTNIPEKKEGVLHLISHLGYIQIDTISVIERAHHHTLWTRCPDYKQEYLHELMAEDKKIFEYWGHAMSYLPMEDYRFYTHAFKRFKKPSDKWNRLRLERTRNLLPKILKRIEQEGPLSSKDFENSSAKKSNGWWDWKPAKIALELLYWQGKLMVSERKNFHRRYDLTKRVLPEQTMTKSPTRKEQTLFWIRRALQSYGIANAAEIKKHIFQVDKTAIDKLLVQLVKSKDLRQVCVKGLDDSYYTFPETFESVPVLTKRKQSLHILSPFDNFVINRDRLQKLFSFDYSLECYLPEPKRKFGYFVLPILYGETFAGRVDIKADRKNSILIIHLLRLEPGFKVSKTFLQALGTKLRNFCCFQGCTKISVSKTSRVSLKKQLESFV